MIPNRWNDGATPLVTSISDIRYFKECRQKWNCASEMRRSMRPGRTPKYFTFGRAFHKAMECYYEPPPSDPSIVRDSDRLRAMVGYEEHLEQEAINDGIDLRDPDLEETMEFGFALIDEYIEWATSGPGIGFKFEVVSTEEAHTIHLFDNVYYGFRTDLIVRRLDDNTLWLIDFKTASTLPTEKGLEYLDTDEQTTAYLHASEQVCNCSFAGIVFVFACTKRFSEPRILKNGQLSKNASQYTTPRIFRRAISELDLNPDDYVDIINLLKEKSPFKSVPVIRSKHEKRFFWDHNLISVVREMVNDPLIYPSPSRINCSMCSYTGPCIAANDPRMSLEAELSSYTKSEPRYLVDE